MRSKTLAMAVLAVGICGTVMAQDAPPAPGQDGRGGGRGMGHEFHGVGGQITAIDSSNITLQTFSGGTAKVKITSSTRIMKDRVEAKLSDFKVGDRVFVAGEQDKDGTWTAQVLGQRTGAGGFPPGGAIGAGMGMQVKPEDNGKTFIAGEITKIDGTKLTIKKPDNAEQVIEVDDDTSFHNERRESVTLADIKVGEMVHGLGAVKDGVFVPKELNAGRPRGQRPGMPPPPDGTQPGQNQTAPDSNDQTK